jgi:hypothetical protein
MSEPITIERLERGLALLAHLIVLDGPVYAPLFEKLERTLDVMRRRQDTVARAKRLLENSGSPMQHNRLSTSGKTTRLRSDGEKRQSGFGPARRKPALVISPSF